MTGLKTITGFDSDFAGSRSMQASQWNVAELLFKSAKLTPHKPALIAEFNGRTSCWTYAELAGSVASVSHQLARAGLRPGSNVLILKGMSPELYAVMLGCFHAGITCTFIDPAAGTEYVRAACKLAQPTAVIGEIKGLLWSLTIPELAKCKRLSLNSWIPGARKLAARPKLFKNLPPPTSVLPDAPALVTFTSGSTGRPKGIVRTHRFLLHQYEAISRSLNLGSGQIHLTALPIFVLANLAAGATTILPSNGLASPSKADPGLLVRQIKLQGVNVLLGSPALVQLVADYCNTSNTQLPRLHHVFTGGGPVVPKLLSAVARCAPNATIHALYGSTEAEPMCEAAYQPDDLPAAAARVDSSATHPDLIATAAGHGLLAGHPVPEAQVRVIRDQWDTGATTHGANPSSTSSVRGASSGSSTSSVRRTGSGSNTGSVNGPGSGSNTSSVNGPASLTSAEFDSMRMAPYQIGEIVVSGEHVVGGYLHGKGNEETKFEVKRQSDGQSTRWHRTGDAGYFDSRGRLWLVGRCSSALSNGRKKVYPLALEAAIACLPDIARCAAVSASGHNVLFIEPSAKHIVKLAQIDLSSAAPLLAEYAIDRIEIVESLPVDSRHNSKIDYGKLAALAKPAERKKRGACAPL